MSGLLDEQYERFRNSPRGRAALAELASRLNVGRAVMDARMNMGLSQTEVAARAGTKQTRVSEIETLTGNVRFDTLDRITRALGLEVTLVPRSTDSGDAGGGR